MDIDPPPHFEIEAKYLLSPVPFSVLTIAPSDLFAGKMHAVLCRAWKNRIKGRDWYDLVWYVQRGITLHLAHLEARMVQSGHWDPGSSLTAESFREALRQRISRLDVDGAKADVRPFLRDPARLDVWSRDFFLAVTEKIVVQ